jgi:hypothetical protein
VLNTKLHYKKLYNFYFYDDKELKNVVWPSNIPGLSRPKIDPANRLRRLKSIELQKSAYSESFMKALMNVEAKDSTVTQEEIEKAGKNDQSSSETEDLEEIKKVEVEFPDVSMEQFLEHRPNITELKKKEIGLQT